MNNSKIKINSEDYWNSRFQSGSWDENLGKDQTHYFYSLLISMLPERIQVKFRQSQYSITDFGCAEGQGVPILAGALGGNVKGVDFSREAIARARELYPQFAFEIADVWQYQTVSDVTVLSNIIEHFPNPYELLKRISSITRKYMIVMVPLEEMNLMTEHCYTFLYENLPMTVSDFRLIYFAEHDCRKDPEQLFLARQVLLVYSREEEDFNSATVACLDGQILARRSQTEEKEQMIQHKLEQIAQDCAMGNINEGNHFELVEHKLEQIARDCATGNINEGNHFELVEHKLEQIAQDCATGNINKGNHFELVEHKLEQIARDCAAGSISQENHFALIENKLDQVFRDSMAADEQQNFSLIQNTVNQMMNVQALTAENNRLSTLYSDVDAKYVELVNRFNQLNDNYGLVMAENARVAQSRTYRVAENLKKLLVRLHLLELVKFMLNTRRYGIKAAVHEHRISRQVKNDNLKQISIANTEELSQVHHEELSDDQKWRQVHAAVCRNCIEHEWGQQSKEIAAIIAKGGYKGIVVYPHAVHWEPVQRPQHFLREFEKQGYLCFFCEPASEAKSVETVGDNLYIVYGEEYLLPVLQNQYPIVLVTYHNQTVFCDMLPQKYLWFDLLDNLDFFDGGKEREAQEIYKKLIGCADLVTYSADNLEPYLFGREDAVKLNNGVNLSDFAHREKERTIPELEAIRKAGKKIAGYYGAIEEWFDIQAIRTILDNTDLEVVLIGRCGIDLSEIQCNRTHIMGAVPYHELPDYTQYFDVALIPFVVNKLTDSVSPVKFFEYAAQGMPVVSSAIHEMLAYQCQSVRVYRNYEELVQQLQSLTEKTVDKAALYEIAEQNTWERHVNAVTEGLQSTVEGLRTTAGISHSGMVSVESVTFFKYDGTTYYSGGAERYLLDLDEVCKELNIRYRVYQYAEYNWVRFYNNVEVVGLGARENDVNQYVTPLINEMCALFSRETAETGALNIYSPFYIINRKDRIPSVGISHGISWDSEFNHYTNGDTFWQINKNIIDSATHCDHMISVDTNTCNWFQTLDYDTGRKIRYVPNYVDNSIFKPRDDYEQLGEKIIITYPRRLYGARGLYVVLNVLDDILERFPNVEFHFVGKGFEIDTKHVEEKIRKWGSRVKWYSKSPDTMYEVYRYTDIALVPTMYSEGTSLSCLEALSSGNAVICTRVGGLTDLILNGYNGLLVEPTGDSLKYAIIDLLENPEKIVQLKRNAVKTAQSFSKEQWKERWKQAILQAVGNRETAPYEQFKRCWIELNSMKQLENKAIQNTVCRYLQDGYYVFLACKNNPMKVQSYYRLQFVDLNEDIYFTPEVRLTGKEILSEA